MLTCFFFTGGRIRDLSARTARAGEITKPATSPSSFTRSSAVTGKSIEFVDFLVVVQLIHRQTKTKIS